MMTHFGLINEYAKWPNFHFLAPRYNNFHETTADPNLVLNATKKTSFLFRVGPIASKILLAIGEVGTDKLSCIVVVVREELLD